MTSLCRRLLLRQAFSKSRHFSWDINPANTMAYADGETKTEEGRIDLSILDLNVGVQCYVLSVDNSMSIQH